MKANITIEMTDEEYEAYKDFINGKYVKKEDLKDVNAYFKMMGFVKSEDIFNRDYLYPSGDPYERFDEATIVYKKGDVKVEVTVPREEK